MASKTISKLTVWSTSWSGLQKRKYQTSHYWPLRGYSPLIIGAFPPQRASDAGKFPLYDVIMFYHSTAIDAPPRHLPHPPLPRRSQSLPTSSLGIRQPLLGPSKESTITKTLLCKRLVVVLAFCAILAIGVVFRLSYEVDSTELPDSNVTTSTDTISTVTNNAVTNSTIQNALFSLAL